MKINNEFIKKYEGYIYHAIRKTGVRHQDTLHEIFNEVVERLLKTVDNYDADKGSPTTWLNYQIRSVVSNYFAKKNRSSDLLDRGKALELADDNQHDTSVRALNNAAIQQASESRVKAYELIWSSDLTLKDKRLLNSITLMKLSLRQIAEELHINRRSVQRKYQRATERLRAYYERHPERKEEFTDY